VRETATENNRQPSIEVPEEEFDRLIRINTKSIYQSAKAVVPVFRKQGRGGVFVNISSISAPRPRPNLVWYGVSKGATSTVGLSFFYSGPLDSTASF
jgi:3-oxoacyl-[acyl-carrier protein] reductase